MTEAMERAKARGSLGIALADLAAAVSGAESVRTRHVRAGFDPEEIASAIATIRSEASPPRALATDAREAVAAARSEATALGHPTIRPVHIWLGVLGQPAIRSALAEHHIAPDSLRQAMVDSPATDD